MTNPHAQIHFAGPVTTTTIVLLGWCSCGHQVETPEEATTAVAANKAGLPNFYRTEEDAAAFELLVSSRDGAQHSQRCDGAVLASCQSAMMEGKIFWSC